MYVMCKFLHFLFLNLLCMLYVCMYVMSFLLSPRIFPVVLSSRSYDDVSDDVTLLLMTWHSTAKLKSCTVQLYSTCSTTMDSMGTRARGWR